MDRCVNRYVNRQIDRWIVRQIGRQTDKQIERKIDKRSEKNVRQRQRPSSKVLRQAQILVIRFHSTSMSNCTMGRVSLYYVIGDSIIGKVYY